MPDVRVICAVGRHGQLGLKGEMPWEGETGLEYVADVQRFFNLTTGHVLLAGPITAASFPDFLRSSRTIVEIRSSMVPHNVISQFPGRVIYICGGPNVWTSYARFIRHWDITKLPYDGEADRYFDPTWLVM